MNMNWLQNTTRCGAKAALLGSVFMVLSWTGAQATSMEEAVRMALATNPDIGIVAHNREAVDAELRQARGLYLPQIDLATGGGWQRDSTESFRDQNRVEWRNRYENSATLTQRLFTGWETAHTVEREKARVESAASRVFENSEFLALDAVGSYHEVCVSANWCPFRTTTFAST